MFRLNRKSEMSAPEEPLPGCDAAIHAPEKHCVTHRPSVDVALSRGDGAGHVRHGLFPEGGEGFLGTRRYLYSTAVSFAGGYTPNPSYK